MQFYFYLTTVKSQFSNIASHDKKYKKVAISSAS